MKKRQVYIKRLERLIKMLKEMPSKQFNIRYWGDTQHPCGTVMCVGGSACFVPEFMKAGLYSGNSKYNVKEDFTPIHKFSKAYNYGFDALCSFFGLTKEESYSIFDGREYSVPLDEVTPQHAIRHIRKVLRSVGVYARKN